MNQCITYEVSLNVKYPWRWMYLWKIDMFDKHYVRMFNLRKILKEFKIKQEKKGSSACEK